MTDAVDAIMSVMETAFDPAYGEAWNRRQLGDSLNFPNTHFLLSGMDGREPASLADTMGFTLSRTAADEEELLLIAVKPHARGCGIGSALMNRLIRDTHNRGVTKVFLEMREGNPAEVLYLKNGFTPEGRRIDYYRSGKNGPFDAITYARFVV